MKKLFKEIHCFMKQELSAKGAVINHFYFCPYHESGSVDQYKKASLKSKTIYPLMALKAAEDLELDLSKSIMVGDKVSDHLYGLGMMTFLLESDYIKNRKVAPNNLVSDHGELLTKLLRFVK